MLGFKKKKKKSGEEEKTSKKNLPNDHEEEGNKDEEEPKPDIKDASEEKRSEKKKKKLLSKKLIFIILLVLIAVGASSYVVYSIYFSSKNTHGKNAKYEKIELDHVNLPEEIVRFSFDYFPDLYLSMITFNKEMNLLDNEIARIDAVAQKYPDQKKIANKEKKTWEKAKTTLQKAFLKIEKPVKATYVLFQVNNEQGLAQIETKSKELTELAQSALTAARELTRKLNSNDKIPEGFIKGNIYKLKKKFL